VSPGGLYCRGGGDKAGSKISCCSEEFLFTRAWAKKATERKILRSSPQEQADEGKSVKRKQRTRPMTASAKLKKKLVQKKKGGGKIKAVCEQDVCDLIDGLHGDKRNRGVGVFVFFFFWVFVWFFFFGFFFFFWVFFFGFFLFFRFLFFFGCFLVVVLFFVFCGGVLRLFGGGWWVVLVS